MSVAPSPSSSRGEIILQPAYFTSSAFVHPARADVERLIQEYSQQYTSSAHSRNHPFTLFKEIWQRQGWTWIQFKVFDTRSRAAFLRVVMRLFSERIGDGETSLSRVAALFGLYTILRTQPSTSAPSLYSTTQIEVTCDVYEEILMLPNALDGEFLLPVRPHVVYVQSNLLQAQVFQILPHAEMHPLSPRALPREVVVEDIEVTPTLTAEGRKKKGRPSKRERTKKARDCLVALERWCGGGDERDEDAWSATRSRYLVEKSALLNVVGRDERWDAALRKANEVVVERMATIERVS
ncbi:hypothetical protein J3R83DRAFT_6431 [Lanmaoa asiatica]|nr:hypothetical protein J3R83DRAFT_6431 [Lanmaoa asiatica]